MRRLSARLRGDSLEKCKTPTIFVALCMTAQACLACYRFTCTVSVGCPRETAVWTGHALSCVQHAKSIAGKCRQARLDLQKLKEAEETLHAYSAAESALPDTETNGHGTAGEEAMFL